MGANDWPTREVTSLTELLELCDELHDADRSPLWFRGHRDCSWLLRPKAFRSFPIDEYSSSIQEDALFVEREMAWQFMLSAPGRHETCPASSEYARWLTLMQHYGLPTRLLDWTLSVSVATYFAVDSISDDINGAIWALRPKHLNTHMIKRFKRKFPYGFSGVLFFEDGSALMRELTEPVFVGEEPGDASILAAVPHEYDRRVTVQQSVFTIHGSTCPLNRPHPPLWGELPQKLLTRIVIPARAKLTICESLSRLGINRAALFPDLDNLALHIRRTHEENAKRSESFPN